MKYIILISILIVLIQCQSGPVWPEQFEQDLTEDTILSFLQFQTKGHFIYDYTNKRYRLDRDNGKGDRFCGSVYKFLDTACSHLVVEGKRYLYFPEREDCCYCCDDAHGCGLVTPNWAADAKFVEISTKDGISTEKWSKDGLQANYIYQNSETKVITGIEMVPNDFQHFIEASFHQGIKDPSRLELPSICSAEKTCPQFSVCAKLQSISLQQY